MEIIFKHFSSWTRCLSELLVYGKNSLDILGFHTLSAAPSSLIQRCLDWVPYYFPFKIQLHSTGNIFFYRYSYLHLSFFWPKQKKIGNKIMLINYTFYERICSFLSPLYHSQLAINLVYLVL